MCLLCTALHKIELVIASEELSACMRSSYSLLSAPQRFPQLKFALYTPTFTCLYTVELLWPFSSAPDWPLQRLLTYWCTMKEDATVNQFQSHKAAEIRLCYWRDSLLYHTLSYINHHECRDWPPLYSAWGLLLKKEAICSHTRTVSEHARWNRTEDPQEAQSFLTFKCWTL